MQSFVDTQGKRWDVGVTVATVARVRRLTGIDLLDIASETFTQSLSDPVNLANVLYAVCEPQAVNRSVTDEQFGESLAGDVLSEASSALLEAIVDFFPDETRRKALRRVLVASREVETQAASMMEAKLDRAIAEGRVEVLRRFEETSTD